MNWNIGLALRLFEVSSTVIFFIALLVISRNAGGERKVLKAYREFAGMLKEREKNSSLYKQMEGWLERKGGNFHLGKLAEPMKLLSLQLILGLLGLYAGCRLGILCGILFLIGLFSLPMLLLVYLNKQDNEKILPELKLVYHALEIQIKAGVYVTDALAECYGSVTEKRLRSALLDLAGDIVLQADITASLEKLQSKFDNPYVDSLCITILQALESGQAVELLRDIGEQLKDMEASILEKKKASMDRGFTFAQLGVLTVVMGIALFLCVNYMFQSAAVF